MYINEPIKKYIDDLAARQPTPGGGSAANLSGALGIALLEMVCNFTIGNKKYVDFEPDINKYITSLKKIREEFMLLIDEDVKVYAAICNAFKTKDELIIDKALKEGYQISLRVCKLSKSGIEIAADLSKKGNVNLITDVGCGAELLRAAFNSGVFNAKINLKGMKEAIFIQKEKAILNGIEKEIATLYEKTIHAVAAELALP